MQYVVEVNSGDPAFPVKPKFFFDGREAISYARRHKVLFPFHRVRVSLYAEYGKEIKR